MTAKTLRKHKFKKYLDRTPTELQLVKGENWRLWRNPSGIGQLFGARRAHGISSSRLASFVLTGIRPRKWNLPSDGYDLAACVRAMDEAPDFLEELAHQALYHLFDWTKSAARAEGFKKGLELGRKLGPEK